MEVCIHTCPDIMYLFLFPTIIYCLSTFTSSIYPFVIFLLYTLFIFAVIINADRFCSYRDPPTPLLLSSSGISHLLCHLRAVQAASLFPTYFILQPPASRRQIIERADNVLLMAALRSTHTHSQPKPYTQGSEVHMYTNTHRHTLPAA